jgi:small subunit ribosomal protein S4
MAHYYGPKVRLSRSVEAPIAETPKHVARKNPKRPGVHGYHRARRSLYGSQLVEKRKVASYYDVRDSQLRRYIRQAQTAKTPSPRALQETLESRLDNGVRRLRWARTIWQARQMVVHGHFLVNGHKVDRPSFCVKGGDTIAVKRSSHDFVRKCAAATEGMGFRVPDWLSVNQDSLEAVVLRAPQVEKVMLPFEADYSKIVEFYTR